MRQHKAGERKAAQRWSSRTQKARTAPPCSPAAGRNRALRHEFGKERLLHKQSAFLRRAPPSANIACAERPFTCRPRSGRKFLTDGQKVRSKLKEEAEKGSGKCAQMARPIIPAMPRATGLSCGNARIGHGTRRVAAVSQQLACCGRIPAHGCSCRLRAGRCCCHRRCGHQEREREPIRGDYMSLGSDSLGLQAWLCRLSCKARRIGHSEMVDHEYVVFVCSGRRPDYIGTKPGWSTIREVWFLQQVVNR